MLENQVSGMLALTASRSTVVSLSSCRPHCLKYSALSSSVVCTYDCTSSGKRQRADLHSFLLQREGVTCWPLF